MNATGTDNANLSGNKAELINRKSINMQTTDVPAAVYTPLINRLNLQLIETRLRKKPRYQRISPILLPPIHQLLSQMIMRYDQKNLHNTARHTRNETHHQIYKPFENNK
jgi:hypothetical protein